MLKPSRKELDAFEARLAILGASAFGCGVVRAYGIAITVFEVTSKPTADGAGEHGNLTKKHVDLCII